MGGMSGMNGMGGMGPAGLNMGSMGGLTPGMMHQMAGGGGGAGPGAGGAPGWGRGGGGGGGGGGGFMDPEFMEMVKAGIASVAREAGGVLRFSNLPMLHLPASSACLYEHSH